MAEPLFRFGVIADVQCADVQAGVSGWGRPRYYRDSLQKLRHAIDCWHEAGVKFALNLGDTIDLKNREKSAQMLDVAIARFSEFRGKVYHVLGNHELHSLLREHPITRLGISGLSDSVTDAYYSFSPRPGWRFIALDSFDLALFGYPLGHAKIKKAEEMLIEGRARTSEPHYLGFNGGMDEPQLRWLRKTISYATEAQERCVVFTHVPLLPEITYIRDAVVWNYREVLDILHSSKAVVCCLYGHEHMGGYATDEAGVHHCAVEAALEAPVGSASHAICEVFEDRIMMRGAGNVRTVEMKFR